MLRFRVSTVVVPALRPSFRMRSSGSATHRCHLHHAHGPDLHFLKTEVSQTCERLLHTSHITYRKHEAQARKGMRYSSSVSMLGFARLTCAGIQEAAPPIRAQLRFPRALPGPARLGDPARCI